jgi:toxin ParE1/3/4
MRSLILRAEAEAEVAEAHRWYERRATGLGSAFIRAVDAALEAVRRQPELCPLKHGRARQVVVRRFPFCIYYILHEDQSIEVIACFHTRKHPGLWRSRA